MNENLNNNANKPENNGNGEKNGNGNNGNNGGKINRPTGANKPKFNGYWIYIAMAIFFIGITFFNSAEQPKEVDWNQFSKMIARQEVTRMIVVNNEKVEIYVKVDSSQNKTGVAEKTRKRGFSQFTPVGPAFVFNIQYPEQQREINDLLSSLPGDSRPEYKNEKRSDYLGIILSWIIPIVLILAVWIFIFRKMGAGGGGGAGNIFNVGKSKAQIFDKDTSVKVDFKDVAGLEEAKMEIKEIVDFLKNPKKYTDLGGKIPKGALLVGPPGTGKTLLAKAVAGEAHVPFFSISGSDFVEMFVGVGASRVRDLFKQAKEKAPCIVFIDEIDAVGRARGRNPNFGANDERENTLNQLLTEMDGFGTNSGVIILAATNRADILDRALLRAGRFDRQIHVELPDLNERNEIFGVHVKPLKLDKALDIEFLARQTPGFSGADIANVCNEAALIAARRGKKSVQKQDFLDAIDRIIGGLEKKNKIMSQVEKETIAFHEAGHATCSWLLEYANPLVKVTIIPRGRSLGAAWYLPEERSITTTEQMLDEMCATLGGRASEEINFTKISTGALNDLERVTKTAYAMISYYGMSSKIGNLSFFDSSGQTDFTFSKPYSDKTAELIDQEAKNMVEQQYERAKKILSDHKEGLVQLAKILLEKEVIFSEDVEKIFGPRKGHKPEEIRKLTKTKKAIEEAVVVGEVAVAVKKSRGRKKKDGDVTG